MSDHPDIEALSAYLDGESEAVAGHVEGCATCRAELDALAEVRARVAAPPPPPPTGAAEQAVGAALRPRRRFPTRWAAAGAVAAVAAGVLVVVSVRPGNHETRTAGSGHGVSAGQEGGAPFINGADLGELADDAALRAKIEPALHQTVGGQESAGGAGGAGQAGAPATASPSPSTNSLAVPRLAAPATTLCEAAARALQPGAQSLLYAATARWQGTPAEVLAFNSAPIATTAPGRQAPVRVYVMAARGCRLLVFQSYAP